MTNITSTSGPFFALMGSFDFPNGMSASSILVKSRRAFGTVSTLYMAGSLKRINPNVATIATRNTSRIFAGSGGK